MAEVYRSESAGVRVVTIGGGLTLYAAGRTVAVLDPIESRRFVEALRASAASDFGRLRIHVPSAQSAQSVPIGPTEQPERAPQEPGVRRRVRVDGRVATK